MMSNDRFSQCLGNICGKYLGDSFEAVITEAYPQLKTDISLRARYADYLNSMDVSDTYNSICALCKISKAVTDFNMAGQKHNSSFQEYVQSTEPHIPEKNFDTIKDLMRQSYDEMLGKVSTTPTSDNNKSIETYQDPQHVLERILPSVKMMAQTFEEIVNTDNHPLINNILNDSYGYLYAQTMYHNEFNPEHHTKVKSEEVATATARQIASCITTKDFPKFIQVIEDNADISAKSMMLIGNLHPQFRQLVAENNPEAREFCKLAATFPRSTFVACVEMKAQGKQIKDFASFQAQVGSEQIIQKAKSYNKATVDMIFQSFDTLRPKNDNASGNITPQKTSNGRE